ncbi:Fic family protein [Desulfofustis glycolicus]|uniref:Cell filamentation protein n=1 Tax=Desulfofustis glycolicus DSM 9705 TaxID=1121409 RepID=A0A1M5WPW2_9BACT|nr:Fic family protein [Desulfofustis glycolicus]MCB2218665.1 Fic family protein [Desulfobulbaceae bacterium]SHH89645.1 cell filamentation protein [Desulfofustis glycolicus DSM 9705]
MDEVEAREQFGALGHFLEVYDRDHRFNAQDICRMHEIWLGPVYEWAGNYRQVNIMKGGFPFAMARQVLALICSGSGRTVRQA